MAFSVNHLVTANYETPPPAADPFSVFHDDPLRTIRPGNAQRLRAGSVLRRTRGKVVRVAPLMIHRRWIRAAGPALSLVAASTVACSAANPWDDPGPEGVVEETIDAPIDVVWDALPRVYGFLNLQPIDAAERASRTISSVRTVQVRSGIVGGRNEPFVRCSSLPTSERTDGGGWPSFQSVDGLATMSVQTRLAESGSSTRIRSEVSVSVDPPAVPAGARIPNCVTTGRLEAQILEGLRATVAPPDSIAARPNRGRPNPF